MRWVQKSGWHFDTFALKDKSDCIRDILAAESDWIVVSSTFQNFVHWSQINSQRDALVTAVALKSIWLQEQCYQRNMRRVHCLQLDTRGGALQVCFIHQVLSEGDEAEFFELTHLDGFQNLFEKLTLFNGGFEHCGCGFFCSQIKWQCCFFFFQEVFIMRVLHWP